MSSILGLNDDDISKNDNEAIEALLFLRDSTYRNYNNAEISTTQTPDRESSTPTNSYVSKDKLELLKTPLPCITPPTRLFSVTPSDNKENRNPNVISENRSVSCNTPNAMTPNNNYNMTSYSRNRFSQKSNVISRMSSDYRPRSPVSPYTPFTENKINKSNSVNNKFTFQDLVDSIVIKERTSLRTDNKRLFPSVIPHMKENGEYKDISLFSTPPQHHRINSIIGSRYTPTRFYMTPTKPQESQISSENLIQRFNFVNNDWKDLDKILSGKNMCAKSDTKNVDLKELYCTLLSTRGKPLMKIYLQLYSVLYIKLKTQEKKKLIRNNINYKIKNLLITYPHLRFYGEPRDFNLTRLQTVPEVLIVIDSFELREKFQSVIVGRAKGSKAAT